MNFETILMVGLFSAVVIALLIPTGRKNRNKDRARDGHHGADANSGGSSNWFGGDSGDSGDGGGGGGGD